MSIGASHNDRWILVRLVARREHGSDFREVVMSNKLMFVAFGYLLLLAALNAGVAAMIVSG
jgi:hypothetical protein